MARNRNTDVSGRPFADSTVNAVWNKGKPIDNYDRNVWRYDMCGKPVAKGGSDDLSNLQPLQWDNNRKKSDTFPWACPAAA